MPTHTTLCLCDLPGLELLTEVCDRLHIHVVAHGGLVRRLVGRLSRTGPWDNLSFNLFDLVPFTSDIDIIHYGSDELTLRLLQAIYDRIPNAECFRWEVRSQTAHSLFAEADNFNALIPSAVMRLSTVPGLGISDAHGGWEDVQDKKYRLIRNPRYGSSPLHQSGRDLEFFSVLLYMTILLDAKLSVAELDAQPGFVDAPMVIQDATTSTATVIALQESAYLRSRLLYLCKQMVAAARSQVTLKAIQNKVGFESLLSYFDRYDARLGNRLRKVFAFPTEGLSSSYRLGGDLFRLPDTMSLWSTGASAQALFDAAVTNSGLSWSPPRQPELAPHQQVLLASPLLPLQLGVAPSTRIGKDAVLGRDIIHEFVYCDVSLLNDDYDAVSPYDDASLAVVMAIHEGKAETTGGGTGSCVLYPLPSACECRAEPYYANDRARLFVRCNALNILGSLPTGTPHVQLFVIGWNPEKERRPPQSSIASPGDPSNDEPTAA